MNRMKRLVSLLAVVAVLAFLPGTGGAMAQQGGPVSGQGALGTVFTYQGLLKDGSGNPITNTCNIQFGLYDALTGGNAKGSSPQTASGVAVNNGYFTVSLDFGPGAFDGNPRWLDIQVKCGAETNYTQLSPRQPLTAAPYALYAVNAGTATNATTAVSAGTATNFTGTLAGDVTGLQGSTTLSRLDGWPVATATPVASQVLAFDGSQWAPANPSGGGGGVTSVSASAPLSSTGGPNPNLAFTGVLPIANGGTGSPTQNFVDLSSAQTIGGAKTFATVITGSISGNAATATTATNFSGALAGDVTGGQGGTKVQKLQGVAVTTTLPTNGQVLQYNGTQWAPASVSTGGVTNVTASAPLSATGGATPNIFFNGVLPIANGGTGSASQNFVDPSSNQTIGGAKTFSSIITGSITGNAGTATSAANFTGTLNGDVMGLQSSTAVKKLQGVPVSTTTPTNGQVLQLVGGQWSPATLGGGVTNVTASAPLSSTGGATPNIFFNGVLPIANGGTGAAVQTFADLSSNQTIGGVKTFSSSITASITGNAATATNFTGALAGDVTGGQTTTTVGRLRGVPVSSTTPLDGQLLEFNGSQWIAADPSQPHSQNVLVVAKSGGNSTSITAALNSIANASQANPWLIEVMPGVYTETVTMKPWVDIRGTSELTTKITQAGNQTATVSTVVGADNAELSFVTVETTGNATTAYAVYINHTAPRLAYVNVVASGGSMSTMGVYIDNHASPVLTNVNITVSGGSTYNYGVTNLVVSASTLTDVTVNVSGGSTNYGMWIGGSPVTMMNVIAVATSSSGQTSYGVYNQGGGAPTMTNVIAEATGGGGNCGIFDDSSAPTMMNVTARASGGGNVGIRNTNGSSPTMTDVNASASGGSSVNTGIWNDYGASPTMTNVVATASGGTGAVAVSNSGSSPTMINVTAVASGGTPDIGVDNAGASPWIMGLATRVTGSGTNYGMYNDAGSSPTIVNANIAISGGALNYGMWNDSSSITIQNSMIAGGNDGLHNVSGSTTMSYTVTVANSELAGGNSSIYEDNSYKTMVGASQIGMGSLHGGAFGGQLTCIYSYKYDFTVVGSGCN